MTSDVTTGPEFNKEAKQAHGRLMLAWNAKYGHVLEDALYTIGRPELVRTPEQTAAMDECHDLTLIGQALDPIEAAERTRKRAERKAAEKAA